MAVLGEFGAAVAEVRRAAEPDEIVFYGERFRVASEVGVMPLMEFAAAADSGLATSDQRGLAAMYDMLRDCLDDVPGCAHCAAPVTGDTCSPGCGKAEPGPSEWDRFRAHAKRSRADAETLLAVCSRLYEVISSRPTGSPSGSSDGPPATSPSSSGSSSERHAALGLVPVDGLTGS